MFYEPISHPSVSPHATALAAQQRRRERAYPKRLFDAACDNVYHFVNLSEDGTRAAYSLTGDDHYGVFWYSRAVNGHMTPHYGGPVISRESRAHVDYTPL